MVANRITFLRKKAGMSQAQLAQKLNLCPSTVGMYEQGRRYPSIDLLVRISEVFDVSLDYLITGAEYQEVKKIRTPETCPCTTCYWKNHDT